MKFKPVIYRNIMFESLFGTALVHAFCKETADSTAWRTHTLGVDHEFYAGDNIHVFNALSPIRVLTLALASAVDLADRLEKDSRYLIVHTDYALTVQYNDKLVTATELLEAIHEKVAEFVDSAYRIQTVFQTDTQLCVMLSFDLSEQFVEMVKLLQTIDHRPSQMSAPFNLEYLFANVFAGSAVNRDLWVKQKQKSWFYASQILTNAPPPDYANRRKELHLLYAVNRLFSRTKGQMYKLALECATRNICKIPSDEMADFLKTSVQASCQLASVDSIKAWALKASEDLSWYLLQELLTQVDSVSIHVNLNEFPIQVRGHTGTFNGTFLSIVQAHTHTNAARHVKAFGTAVGTEIPRHGTVVSKQFILPYDATIDLTEIENALSVVNNGNLAFVAYEQIGYDNNPQWLRVQYYAAITAYDRFHVDSAAWYQQHFPLFEMTNQLSGYLRLHSMELEREERSLEDSLRPEFSPLSPEYTSHNRAVEAADQADQILLIIIQDWFLNHQKSLPSLSGMWAGLKKALPPMTSHKVMYVDLPQARDRIKIMHGSVCEGVEPIRQFWK